jgi:hypothetical protein
VIRELNYARRCGPDKHRSIRNVPNDSPPRAKLPELPRQGLQARFMRTLIENDEAALHATLLHANLLQIHVESTAKILESQCERVDGRERALMDRAGKRPARIVRDSQQRKYVLYDLLPLCLGQVVPRGLPPRKDFGGVKFDDVRIVWTE